MRIIVNGGMRKVRGCGMTGIKRHYSWGDYNPFKYVYNGTQSIYEYFSNGSNNQNGKDSGSNNESNSDQAGSFDGVYNPVIIDLRHTDTLIDETNEPLNKLKSVYRITTRLLMRYKSQILMIFTKFIKSILIDYYEYLILAFVFIAL